MTALTPVNFGSVALIGAGCDDIGAPGLLSELIPTEFRDHPVFGYEILAWESELPNPSLYLPIPIETAREKNATARAVLSVPVRVRMVRR